MQGTIIWSWLCEGSAHDPLVSHILCRMHSAGNVVRLGEGIGPLEAGLLDDSCGFKLVGAPALPSEGPHAGEILVHGHQHTAA